MATPYEKPAGSGRYLVRYKEPGNPRDIRKSFTTGSAEQNQHDAWQFYFGLQERRAAITDDTLVRDYVPRYMVKRVDELDDEKLADGTILNARSDIKNYIIPLFGHEGLRALTADMVRERIDGMKLLDGRTPGDGTKRKVRNTLSSMLEYAKVDKLVDVNVAQGLKFKNRKRGPRPKPQMVTELEIHRLLDEVPDRWRAYALLVGATGMRPNEARSLRCDDFRPNLRARVIATGTPGTIHLDSQLNRQRQPRALKSGHSYRDIAVEGWLMDALRAHLTAFPPDADGHLFCSRQGRPVSIQYLGEVIKTARERARLGDHVTWRSLRHREASGLAAAGHDPAVAAERMGHSAAVYYATYVHPLDASRKALTEAIQNRDGIRMAFPGGQRRKGPGQRRIG